MWRGSEKTSKKSKNVVIPTYRTDFSLYTVAMYLKCRLTAAEREAEAALPASWKKHLACFFSE